jgi:hypothetical protein
MLRHARERRLPFIQAADFDFSTARVVEDRRSDYPSAASWHWLI